MLASFRQGRRSAGAGTAESDPGVFTSELLED